MLRFAIAVTLLLSLIVPAGLLQAASFETQTNREGSVTVKVTPRDISPQAGSWEFEIVFDTHTALLDQDMRRTAVLVDGSGTEQQPQAWEGDPPGGHHRKGILRFPPPRGTPEYIELRIRGTGGVAERIFRWRMTE